jgi:hypothetical protein
MGPFGKVIKGGICSCEGHSKERSHDDVKNVKARYGGITFRMCKECRIELGWEKPQKCQR